MTAVPMPPGWEPTSLSPPASLQQDMESAGDYDALLKRHGVEAGRKFKPGSPWGPDGAVIGSRAPVGPGTGPTNGGIAGRHG